MIGKFGLIPGEVSSAKRLCEEWAMKMNGLAYHAKMTGMVSFSDFFTRLGEELIDGFILNWVIGRQRSERVIHLTNDPNGTYVPSICKSITDEDIPKAVKWLEDFLNSPYHAKLSSLAEEFEQALRIDSKPPTYKSAYTYLNDLMTLLHSTVTRSIVYLNSELAA